MAMLGGRGRRAAVLAVLAACAFPALAWSANLIVNGVPIGKVDIAVQGLEGVTFEKCTAVKVEQGGDVKIDCPGYDLQAAAGSGIPVATAPIVPGRITKKYWIVTEQTEPGATQFDVDMYVNSKWIKRFKNDDEQIVFEITKHLVPGRNKVLFAPTKNLADARKSMSPNVHYRFVVGEGESSAGHVMIDQPLIDLKLTAAETAATPKSFELLAR
jgi:hypothetical protein